MENQLVLNNNGDISKALSEFKEITNRIKSVSDSIKKRETPKQYQKKRKAKGGGFWTYVKVDYLEDELNKDYPGWSFHLKEWKIIGRETSGFVATNVSLSIIDNGIKRTIEDIGGSEIKYYGKEHERRGDYLDLPNDIKAAITDGFKRCCYRLGYIRDIKYEPADLDMSEEQYGILVEAIKNGKQEWKEKIKEFAYKNLNRANFQDFMTDTILPMLEKYPEKNIEQIQMLRKMYGVVDTQDVEIVEEKIESQVVPGVESAANDDENPPWEDD